MKRGKYTILVLVITVSIIVFLLLNLLLGSVSIPFASVWNILTGGEEDPVAWQNIILKSRLPQALTALVAGAGLSISGLQMQTIFRNPLAGPSVLGISSGASLGVAFVVLLSGQLGGVALSRLGFIGEVALSIAAVVGALSVMGLIVLASRKVAGSVTLLIKPLNLLMLGDGYARNLGLNINRARVWVITCAGVLTAIVTAYCGPIIFLGLAVPHLCRAIFQTSDHRVLMPASMLVGASLALLCNLIARLPGFEGALPVNSVTALVGAPVVASVLFGKRKRKDAIEF